MVPERFKLNCTISCLVKVFISVFYIQCSLISSMYNKSSRYAYKRRQIITTRSTRTAKKYWSSDGLVRHHLLELHERVKSSECPRRSLTSNTSVARLIRSSRLHARQGIILGDVLLMDWLRSRTSTTYRFEGIRDLRSLIRSSSGTLRFGESDMATAGGISR